MKELILITGASAGIGQEMARQLAAQHHHLILVARREDRLLALKEELEAQHLVKVAVFGTDLSDPHQAIQLYERIKQKGLKPTQVVNNAGFGEYGDFTETDLKKELDMIQVNISSLTVLTKLYARDMKIAKRGHIMNIASILSFFPFPYYSVYAATKAYVLSFTEAVRTEMQGTGVKLTAFCPGPTDTEFTTAGMLATNAYKSMKPVDVKEVAAEAIDYLMHGKGTKVVGFMNNVLINTPRFSPRWLTLMINKHMASPA